MLSVEKTNIVRRLFEQKKWTSGHWYLDTEEKLFNRVCEFLVELGDQHFSLAMSLLSKYDIISNYETPIRSISASLPGDLFNANPCYVFPISEKTSNEIKSGHAVAYEFKARHFPRLGSNVEIVDSIYSSEIIFSPAARFIAIDDFIGTGTQFDASLGYLFSKGIDPSAIAALVICIQHSAYQKLNDYGIAVYKWLSKPKAISDMYAVGQLSAAQALAAYLEMTTALSVTDDYRLGYGEAEALVSMKRTPDDTLSLFWWPERAGGAEWPAPFPR